MEKTQKVSDIFKATIKAYLDERATHDKLFARTYAKENKNIDECCNYILQQVRESGCQGFADEEIYNMAIHYYDEDEIKGIKPVKSGQIVVNHVVELTDEEKAEIKAKMKAKFEQDQIAKIKNEERKKESERIRKAQEVKKIQEKMQLSLFD